MKRRQFLGSCALAALPLTPTWAGLAAFHPPAPSEPGQKGTSLIEEGETSPRITLVSCGGAAQALCRGLRPADLGLHRHLALDSSPRACHPESQRWVVSAGERKPKTPEAARHATHRFAGDIGKVMHGSDLVIIAAGPGGAAGTGIALGVQDIAARLGIPTL